MNDIWRNAFEGCDGLEVLKLPEALRRLDGKYDELVLPKKTKKIRYTIEPLNL